MHFSMDSVSAHQTYNLLIGLVIPRPIALVTSHNLQGHLNAAPFSSYNYLSTDPPIIGLGIASRPGKEVLQKDTAKNILDTREFVVNVVTEDIMEKMNICAIDFPSEVSEVTEAGFHTVPSEKVAVPRLKEVHAALECRHHTTLQIGRSHIVLGQVVGMYIDDQFVDPAGPYVRSELLAPLGRANGLGSYVKTRDSFTKMPRIRYEDWLKNKK